MTQSTTDDNQTPTASAHPGRHSSFEFPEFDKVYELPSGYLSVSQVGLFHKCGERYRRRYVDNQRTPNSSNLGHGRLIHKAVEKMLQFKIDNDQRTPPPELGQDAITDHMQEMTQDIEIWDPKVPDMEVFEDTARELVEIYNDTRLPEARPRVVELKLQSVLRGRVPFVGYTDLIEASPMNADLKPFNTLDDLTFSDSVRDLKATGKKYGASRVENALQLTLYAVMTGLEHVGYDLLVQKKKSEFSRQDSIRTPREKEHGLDVVEDAARAISAGVFMKTDPQSWMCTEKWCPYYSECRGSSMSVHDMGSADQDI